MTNNFDKQPVYKNNVIIGYRRRRHRFVQEEHMGWEVRPVWSDEWVGNFKNRTTARKYLEQTIREISNDR